MKTVSILLNDREIEKFQLTKPTMYIGRSPTCDVILRAKSVRPLHFVIEWFGEGAFDSDKGFWSVIDISQSAKKGLSTGEGVILSNEKIQIGNLQFKLSKDDLAESHLKKGVLKRSVDQSLESDNILTEGLTCLEVVSISNSLESVENVSHYDYNVNKNLEIHALKTLPRIKFVWKDNHLGFLDSQAEAGSYEVFNKNELVSSTEKSKNNIEISDRDVLIVRSQSYDYYLRLVPKVKLVKSSKFLFDQTLQAVLIILIILFLFSVIIPQLPSIAVEKPDEARIARVELYKPEPVIEKVPVPEIPEKIPEKVKQAALPIPDIKPKEKPTMAAPTVKTVDKKPKETTAGLSIKAPVKTVNKMGILGAIKANKSSGSRATVSADQIIGNRPPSELETRDASVLVAKTKAGTLGAKTKDGGSGGTGNVNLESASTTLKNSFVKSHNGSGVIAKTDGSTLERGLPSSAGKFKRRSGCRI